VEHTQDTRESEVRATRWWQEGEKGKERGREERSRGGGGEGVRIS